MRAPATLLSLCRISPEGGGIRMDDDGALTQVLDRLLVLTALADAALDGSPGARRLHDHLSIPCRVAAGALAAVATRESQPWVAPLFAGGASAWLGQKAERAWRHELTCLGLPPIMVGLAEGAVALSLPVIWRRWPVLGLAGVPLGVGFIFAARARKVSRYAALSKPGDACRYGRDAIGLGSYVRPRAGMRRHGLPPSGPDNGILARSRTSRAANATRVSARAWLAAPYHSQEL